MNLNDKKLLVETENFVREEKKYTLKILQNLKEIDAKKLFCDLGYSSLFSYCKEHLKYSDQESAIRVNAMRLMRDLPEAKSKIEKGTLNLTNAGTLFSDMKKYERASGKKLSHADKSRLVGKIEGQSTRSAKAIIENELSLQKISKETKVEVKLSQKTLDRLTKLQDKLNMYDLELLLNCLMDEKENSLMESQVEVTLAPELKEEVAPKTKSRYIPLKTKRLLLKKANYQCEFVASNGKRCNGFSHLQVEHRKPFAFGGSNQIENLKILCFSHNQHAYLRFKTKVN